jgi:hypothetical protein
MAKTIVMILGVVFVIIGVLGFFNDPVLGIFEVDAVHNIVHLLSGVVALALASMGDSYARTYAKVFGVIYLLVTVLGFVMGTDEKLLGLLEINNADNYLHVLLTVVLLAVGFSKSSAPSGPTMNAPMGGPTV